MKVVIKTHTSELVITIKEIVEQLSYFELLNLQVHSEKKIKKYAEDIAPLDYAKSKMMYTLKTHNMGISEWIDMRIENHVNNYNTFIETCEEIGTHPKLKLLEVSNRLGVFQLETLHYTTHITISNNDIAYT